MKRGLGRRSRYSPPWWFTLCTIAIVAVGVIVIGVGRIIEYPYTPSSVSTQTTHPSGNVKYAGPPKMINSKSPSERPGTTQPIQSHYDNTGYATPAPGYTHQTVTPSHTPKPKATATVTPTPKVTVTPSSTPTPTPTSVTGSGSPTPTGSTTGLQTGDQG